MRLYKKRKKFFKKNEEAYKMIGNKKSKSINKRKNYFLLFIIIVIIVIIILVLIIKYLTISKVSPKIKIKKYNEYTREEALQKGRNYLDKCLDGQLIKKAKFKKIKNPKISVIIPLYNNAKKIKSVIRSAQNQNMEDIEIIIINDFSTDNSTKVIEELQKDDKRIKLINNKKNLGILHSRAIGVLEAKGKYITNLDHDDLFFDDDIFEVAYEEAEEKNFDIISFMKIDSENYTQNANEMTDNICSLPDNFTVYQPNLTYYLIFEKERFKMVDIWIWGKLFLADTYKKAINLLGKERYSVFNAINEDIIGLFSICLSSQSYKFIRKYGIFHFISDKTASRRVSNDHFMKMDIFFSEILFDLSKNENKKYAAFIIIPIKSKFYFTIKNEETKDYLRKMIQKILNCEYIEEKYKNEIRHNYEQLGLLP